MELAGDLLSAAVFDALIFLAEIVIAIFIVLRRHTGYERIFMMFYGAVTFSAVNVFIQVVHDFNIPIARTALFKIPIVGQVYLFDGVTIIICMAIAVRYLLKGDLLTFKTQQRISMGYQLYTRDAVLFILSFIAFYIFSENSHPVDIASQIRPLRGLAMGILFGWLYIKLLNGIVDKNHVFRIIFTLALLDMINISGELLSAPFFGKYLWDRGWHKVLLLDQANYMLVLCYLPLLFSWKQFGRIPSLFGLAVLAILFYDYVKGLYFFIPISIALYFMISCVRGRISKWLIYPIFFIPILAVAFLPTVLQDKAIKGTRAIQLGSYLTFVSHMPTAILWGTGIGGMYPVLEDTEDKGEIKEGDRNEISDSIYQVQFQVPVFYFFKIAGFLGVFIVVIAAVLGLYKAYLVNGKNKLAGFYSVIAVFSSIMVPPFLNPEPNEIVYFCRLLFMVAILDKFYSKLHSENDAAFKKLEMNIIENRGL